MKHKLDWLAAFLFICFFLAVAIGYVLNIAKLMSLGADSLGMLAVRVVGVVAPPLGGILGYF